jgi:AraC family transcriptional regulator
MSEIANLMPESAEFDGRRLGSVSISIGEAHCPAGISWGPELTREIQFGAVLEGRASVWLDGERLELRAPSVVVALPGQEQRWAIPEGGDARVAWIHLRFSQLDPRLLDRLRVLSQGLRLTTATADLVRSGIALDPSRLSTRDEALEGVAHAIMWRAIGEAEAGDPPETDSALAVVLAFVDGHLSDHLTATDLAAAARVSPSQLLRLCRSRLATTPMAYVWKQRLARGLRMLEETALPISLVAASCGFRSSFHFSRKVKEKTGVSPRELRRRGS